MEFLRFGSSIPGSYWGCCAVDIIQNFKCDPDSPASIQLVYGDSGQPCGDKFAGPTYRDIFWQRLRIGTFDTRDMPNHAFIAVLTDWQVREGHGKKWMEILKEAGFEFIRSVSNSVYTGNSLAPYSTDRGRKQNYIFMLVRNIGASGDGDPFTPPQEWIDLSSTPAYEGWQFMDTASRLKLAAEQHALHTKVWNTTNPFKPLSRQQLKDAGVPVTLAGCRSENMQELDTVREERKKSKPNTNSSANPFLKAS